MEEKERLYVENRERWQALVDKAHFIDEHADVKKYTNGMILPVKKIKPEGVLDYLLRGGVVDENNRFVAGWLRKLGDPMINKSCQDAYEFDRSAAKVNHSRVIFGGIVDEHFGHFMSESMSRLWYVVQNPDFEEKIVFLPDAGVKEWYQGFWDLLGISADRIIYLEEPTVFDEIIVPEETMYLWSGFRPEIRCIYDKIVENAPKKEYDKVYLTRGQLSKQDCVNEEYFVEYFRERGYEIVAPETLPIMEQVSVVAGAGEIACVCGTLSHFILFAAQGTKITILNRTNDHFLEPQVILNKVRDADYYFVDISKNFLPVKHSRGCFLLEPTSYWDAYLEANGMPKKEYPEDVMHANAYEFLKTWYRIYHRKAAMDTVADFDMCDLLNRLRILEDDHPSAVKRGDYGFKNRISEYRKKNKAENEEIERLRKENAELRLMHGGLSEEETARFISKLVDEEIAARKAAEEKAAKESKPGILKRAWRKIFRSNKNKEEVNEQ